MASIQVLLAVALAFVCLEGQASATLKEHCSDVSFLDFVRYRTSGKQCCDTTLKQIDNVCKDVTAVQCELKIHQIENQPKTIDAIGKASNTKIKHALAISNQIIDHDNALIKQGLLPKYSLELEWFRPSHEKVDYGDGTCNENKNRILFKDLMGKWRNLSETYKIPYFLHAGSLLGAARNADAIPWDGDMDILVDGRFREVIAAIANERNFDRYDGDFHLVIQKDFRKPPPDEKKGSLYYTKHRRRWDCKGKQVEKQTDNCAFQDPLARLVKNGRHMDLFDYHYKDDIIYKPSGHRTPVELTFPLRKCMFLEIEVLCPQKTIEFLKNKYGDGVMVPKKKCNNTRWIPL